MNACADGNRESRLFGIFGHPRSGTGYMADLFYACGFDVLHENVMGEDGITSWILPAWDLLPANHRWGADPAGYAFKYQIHVVRNPRLAISSALYGAEVWALEYMDQAAGTYKDAETTQTIHAAVKRYLFWNRLIEKRAVDLRVQVEEAPLVLYYWLGDRIDGWSDSFHEAQMAGLQLPRTDVNNHTKMSRLAGKKLKYLTWREIEEETGIGTFKELEELSCRYGY